MNGDRTIPDWHKDLLQVKTFDWLWWAVVCLITFWNLMVFSFSQINQGNINLSGKNQRRINYLSSYFRSYNCRLPIRILNQKKRATFEESELSFFRWHQGAFIIQICRFFTINSTFILWVPMQWILHVPWQHILWQCMLCFNILRTKMNQTRWNCVPLRESDNFLGVNQLWKSIPNP